MNQIQTIHPLRVVETSRRKQAMPDTGKAPAFSAEIPGAKLSAAPASLMRVYFGALSEAQKKAFEKASQISATAITSRQLATETEELSWHQYLEKLIQQPEVSRYAYQRVYDMIMREGSEPAFHDDGSPMISDSGDRIMNYPFFQKRGIAGTEEALHELTLALEEAAHGDDTKFRFILLKGPVGTAKSTIVNILKKGLEEYSRTDEGALYALVWDDLPKPVAEDLKMDMDPETETYRYIEPMRDDPIRVIPEMQIVRNGRGQEQKINPRRNLMGVVNDQYAAQSGGKAPYELQVDGELSPASFLIRSKLLEYYDKEVRAGRITLPKGKDLMSLVLDNHVKASRYILSETMRQGVGTYTPKDAKNQDSTELNGDIDYTKLPMYGDPNHPLAQAYRGEFNIANRGIMDFEEMLKLQREFLYDVLHASQERVVKPKNGTMLALDSILIGKSNMEEVDEKSKDDKMKAFWNRAVEILVRYLMEPGKEAGIYRAAMEDRAAKRGYAVAPRTIDVAVNWAIRTRKDARITGKTSEADGTGLYGIGPRFLQNVFARSRSHSQTKETMTVSPFTVFRIIEDKIKRGDTKEPKNLPIYLEHLEAEKSAFRKQLEGDVFEAFMKDEEMLLNYLKNYLDNLVLWKDPETRPKANEEFMRQVEKTMKASVDEQELLPFRQDLLMRREAILESGGSFEEELLREDANLSKALADVMFSELKAGLSKVPRQEVVSSMVDNLGYPPAAAQEVIEHLTTPNGIL